MSLCLNLFLSGFSTLFSILGFWVAFFSFSEFSASGLNQMEMDLVKAGAWMWMGRGGGGGGGGCIARPWGCQPGAAALAKAHYSLSHLARRCPQAARPPASL